MVEHVLLTTALEETWPEGLDTPVLFLGEWCKLFSQEERWSAMNSKVLAYHADDREKLHQNFLYLQALYKKFISAVARRLNEIHNVDHSIRYWDILAGPWLVYFLQIIFDRWSTIQQVNRQNLDFETKTEIKHCVRNRRYIFGCINLYKFLIINLPLLKIFTTINIYNEYERF